MAVFPLNDIFFETLCIYLQLDISQISVLSKMRDYEQFFCYIRLACVYTYCRFQVSSEELDLVDMELYLCTPVQKSKAPRRGVHCNFEANDIFQSSCCNSSGGICPTIHWWPSTAWRRPPCCSGSGPRLQELQCRVHSLELETKVKRRLAKISQSWAPSPG